MELTVVDISPYLTQRQVCRVLTEEALRLFHLYASVQNSVLSSSVECRPRRNKKAQLRDLIRIVQGEVCV